jgi:hypothetical protein
MYFLQIPGFSTGSPRMQKAGGKRLFRDNKTLLSRPGPGAALRLTGRHVHGEPILRLRSFKTAPDQVFQDFYAKQGSHCA